MLVVSNGAGWAMRNDADSLKIAALIALVIVVEISKADAATLTQTADMPTIQTAGESTQSNSATVDFNQFNTALGALTDVQLSLTSSIDVEIVAQGFNPGKHQIRRFALTRHMNVRSRKNTRFTGLEMLKGRESTFG